MARVHHIVTNLTGGELSPRAQSRVDIKKYASGLRTCLNATILPYGGARRRSGTKFVIECRDTNPTRFVPFQYATEQSYMLLFGNEYIWFFKDGGIITETAQNITSISNHNPAVVTLAGHGYSNGDYVLIQSAGGMTEVNNRRFVVQNATANTFELQGTNSNSYGAYTSGGTVAAIVTLETTYTQDQLADLAYAQIGDTLYVTHPEHPLRKISRTSHTAWTLSTPDITTGPFRTINSDRTNLITVGSYNTASITAATKANPCVVTFAGGHNFRAGVTITITGVSGMTDLNGNTYTVANPTATTIELSGIDSSAYGVYTSGGSASQNANAYGCYPVGVECVLTAATPTFDVDMVGSIFRLWEEGAKSGVTAPPLGDANISVAVGNTYTFAGNVYGVQSISGAHAWKYYTRVPDHDSGTMKVTDSAGRYFLSDFLHSGYCIVRITAFTSSTQVSAEIVRYQLPAAVVSNGTSYWAEGAWSDYRGYPRAIATYEQRLWLAGVAGDPNVVWSTKTGIYESFEDGTDDDDAIIYRVTSGQADVIRWLSAGRVLAAGTSQGEYAFAASNQNEAVTPSNIKAVLQTTYGTSAAMPVRIGQAVLYPQRNGALTNNARKVREFSYEYAQDSFASVDLTVFAEHITGDGITEMAYQLEPDSIIWALRTDGSLPACTYERAQEVVAWHRHEIGGGMVENIGVIPGASGDDLWLKVERTVDSTTVHYIEILAQAFGDTDDTEDGIFMDASATYSGASTSTISGLWHLRGKAVLINNDGAMETGTVSATGTLTLENATTLAHIGIEYETVIETQALEAGAQAGTAQGQQGRISKVWVRLLNSLGGTVGPDEDNQEEILYRIPADAMDSSPPLFSGLKELDIPASWEEERRVMIRTSDPYPLHVTGVIAELTVSA